MCDRLLTCELRNKEKRKQTETDSETKMLIELKGVEGKGGRGGVSRNHDT